MNKYKISISYFIFIVVCILLLYATSVLAQGSLPKVTPANEKYKIGLYAEKAAINNETVRTIKKMGVTLITLKENIAERVSCDTENEPDITFRVKLPMAGKYRIFADVVREDKITPGEKVETRLVKLRIDNQRITRRIVSNLHEYSGHDLGIFDLNKEHDLKIWLPQETSFESLRIEEYIPVEVPAEVASYIPQIIPSGRPRLWINKDNLPTIRERLTKGENIPIWYEVQEKAKRPFPFRIDIKKEIFHNNEVEDIALIKAFYYLMTGDKTIGQETVNLMLDYLSVLEFGNVRHGDITRELGKSIYTTAIVYDWCYHLLSERDKESLYKHMIRLAPEMEIGWPPFKEHVVNGHASEAQVNRDLLAMGIAVYERDPEPYRYTSYLMLEQLLPMRAFEYQSPRHNQGFDYGAYRHAWEMHAAWMFYRMTGVRIFNDNITSLSKYWLYMQLPDGKRFSDGDKFSKTHVSYPETLLLDYAYAGDALLKGEFERRGGLERAKVNPVLFLLLNDPGLKANPNLNDLPLSIDYGSILGGLSARTGWDMAENSNDVAAEIRGGGYHFGNHQHSDAGSFQIYYRGEQVFNVGIYRAYGTPYDFNFYKRSVAHNTILVKDPDEKLAHRTNVNDGGSRFNQRNPKSPDEVLSDPWFDYGTVLSADFEANTLKPSYSYFKADLTAAYYSKISNYTRSFCFLNLNRDDIPAAVILADDLTTSKDDFSKFWKINTFNEPVRVGQNVILHNSNGGLVGKAHINMLLPLPEERNIEVSSLKDSTSILGTQYQIKSSLPEANAYQVVVYPKKKSKHTRFLSVFQMTADGTEPLPIDFYETDNKYIISLQDRIVCMSAGYRQIQESFVLNVDDDSEFQILIADLKPGFWNVENVENGTELNFNIKAGKNTIFFKGGKGKYVITPGRSYTVGE